MNRRFDRVEGDLGIVKAIVLAHEQRFTGIERDLGLVKTAVTEQSRALHRAARGSPTVARVCRDLAPPLQRRTDERSG